MSNIGYHRVVYFGNSAPSSVGLYVNNILTSTKYIVKKELCTKGKLLKYLDRNGQYRYWGFSQFFEERINAESLGRTNELITSILSAQSDTKDLGSEINNEIDLVAENVSSDELLVLSQINFSPRVYYYIGNGSSYSDENWLLVEVTKKSDIKKYAKGNFSKFEITIKLPTNKSISTL